MAAEQRWRWGVRGGRGAVWVTSKHGVIRVWFNRIARRAVRVLLNWLPNRAGRYVYLAAERYLVRVDVTRLVKVDGGL